MGNIIIEISDNGVEFNPIEKGDVDINIPLQEKQIGGLGLFFVKQKIDKIEYTRVNNKNLLKLTKIII